MPFYASRLSDHISATPEGFLVCRDAVLCRTATRVPQRYRGSELGLRTDDIVNVYRSPEEVLSEEFLASLEGKSVTDTHPGTFLDADNASWYTKGHVQHVKRGPRLPDGEQSVIGNLVVTDSALIEKIKSGVRELSVGYQCEYVPNGNGTFSQTKLRGNHVAVVPDGRAGKHVRILDAVKKRAEDFVDVCRAYLGKANPSTVAAERTAALKGSTAEEMLRSAEPNSFDDLAAELQDRYSPEHKTEDCEDEMPKKTFDEDELRAMVRQIIADELAKSRPKRSMPEAIEPEYVLDERSNYALQRLRQMRPMIEQSGDREAILSYNRAVKALKSGRSVPSEFQLVSDRLSAGNTDDWLRRVERARARMHGEEVDEHEEARQAHAEDALCRNDDEAWGRRIMREFHGKNITRRESSQTRAARDSQESFVDAVARHRKRMREGK
jgi:hypothetical protein